MTITDRKIDALQKHLNYIRLAIRTDQDKSENYIANHLFYVIRDIMTMVERDDRKEAIDGRDSGNS